MKYRIHYILLAIIFVVSFLTSCATTPYLIEKNLEDELKEASGNNIGFWISTKPDKKIDCEKYGHTPYLAGQDRLRDGHAHRCIDCKEICEIEPHTLKRTEAFDLIITDGTCYLRTRDVCECHQAFLFHYEPVDLTGVPVTSSPAGMTLEEADVYFDEMEAEGFGEWVEYAKGATE